MNTVWIVFVEVVAHSDSSPPEGTFGFINVVVCADDAESAEARVLAVFEEYGWQMIRVGSVSEVDPNRDYQDDLLELIHDVLTNPQHARLSTLHTYKPNRAAIY